MTDTEFEYGVERVRGRLLAVARRFVRATGGAYDCEDIVQEALAELHLLRGGGYEIRDMEALAVKITKTVCVRHFRKRKLQTVPLEGIDPDGGSEATERTDIEDAGVLQDRLMSSLTPTQRQYLRMRNGQGMSLDEIADQTRRPKSSIKATLSQAKKVLISIIKQGQ